MLDSIFKNWKTSVAGTVLGVGQYLVLQGEHGFTWETFFTVLPTILLGAFAGDRKK